MITNRLFFRLLQSAVFLLAAFVFMSPPQAPDMNETFRSLALGMEASSLSLAGHAIFLFLSQTISDFTQEPIEQAAFLSKAILLFLSGLAAYALLKKAGVSTYESAGGSILYFALGHHCCGATPEMFLWLLFPLLVIAARYPSQMKITDFPDGEAIRPRDILLAGDAHIGKFSIENSINESRLSMVGAFALSVIGWNVCWQFFLWPLSLSAILIASMLCRTGDRFFKPGTIFRHMLVCFAGLAFSPGLLAKALGWLSLVFDYISNDITPWGLQILAIETPDFHKLPILLLLLMLTILRMLYRPRPLTWDIISCYCLAATLLLCDHRLMFPFVFWSCLLSANFPGIEEDRIPALKPKSDRLGLGLVLALLFSGLLWSIFAGQPTKQQTHSLAGDLLRKIPKYTGQHETRVIAHPNLNGESLFLGKRIFAANAPESLEANEKALTGSLASDAWHIFNHTEKLEAVLSHWGADYLITYYQSFLSTYLIELGGWKIVAFSEDPVNIVKGQVESKQLVLLAGKDTALAGANSEIKNHRLLESCTASH